jgi:hypothetical protein
MALSTTVAFGLHSIGVLIIHPVSLRGVQAIITGLHLAFPSPRRRGLAPTARSLLHIFSCSGFHCSLILYPMSRCHRLEHHSSLRLFYLLISYVTTILKRILSWPEERINCSVLFSEQSKTHHETNYPPGPTRSHTSPQRHHSPITPLVISFIRYTSLQQTVLSAVKQAYILSVPSTFGATKSERLRFIPFYFNSTAHLT